MDKPYEMPDNIVNVDTGEEELIKHCSAEIFCLKVILHTDKSCH